jgi:hypothetical protein
MSCSLLQGQQMRQPLLQLQQHASSLLPNNSTSQDSGLVVGAG